MISWYFMVGAIISIPLSIWLIYDEWIGHHANPKYVSTESVTTNILISCFISLFWPVTSVFIFVFTLKGFLIWYDKIRQDRGPK